MNFYTAEMSFEYHAKSILKQLHEEWRESGSEMEFADWLELRDNASSVAMAFLAVLFDWCGGELETLID